VAGEIDLTTEPELRAALTGWDRRATSRVVVDLSQVTFCGLEGARALHLCALRAHDAGRRPAMVLGNPVSLVLDTAGLGRHIVRYERLADALADTGPPGER
jgi:anti-anti-sigma regulatory factor